MIRRNFFAILGVFLITTFVVNLTVYISHPKTHFHQIKPTASQSFFTTFRAFEQEASTKTVTASQLEAISTLECNKTVANKTMWRIEVPGNKVMSLDEYKQWQAVDFIRRKANPVAKRMAHPTISPFKKSYADPKFTLHDWREDIDLNEITANLEKERHDRSNLNDDDILQIPEVKEEVFYSTYKIPNIIHFVWFGCRQMGVVHYMTMLGALKYQNPRLILIHGDCPPMGEYWDHLNKRAGDKIRLIKRTPPKEVWGIPIEVIEHRSDVARLQILLEVGGIYLDTDSFVLRNFDALRNHTMLLPEECGYALANSVIFANRDAWFLRRWYHEYKYFKDKEWGTNSVVVPWALWKIFPDKIFVSQGPIGRPSWPELGHIYWELYDWHNHYIMHVFSRFTNYMVHTQEHTLKELAILNTTFGEMSRHILWGDEKARDITDWIVSCNQTQGLID